MRGNRVGGNAQLANFDLVVVTHHRTHIVVATAGNGRDLMRDIASSTTLGGGQG